MSMHLIYGPTSVGKTAASIALARRTGAPVIALDRLQCCPELATGSGRPSADELNGTRRIYMAARRLPEGMISAQEANQRLKALVAACMAGERSVILEGGSVSLLQEMVSDPHWAGFSWSCTRLHLADPASFMSRARRRVRQMLHPGDGRPSLLEELLRAWPIPAARPIIEDIDGYRCAIRFAHGHGCAIPELLHLDPVLEEELVEEIAQEYLQHARWQEEEFPELPAAWARPGVARLPGVETFRQPRSPAQGRALRRVSPR